MLVSINAQLDQNVHVSAGLKTSTSKQLLQLTLFHGLTAINS
jgi:hypothetical protein